MADLARVGKSGGKWTMDDLAAYNVRIETEDVSTFFGIPELPDPTETPAEILTGDDQVQATTVVARRFTRNVRRASSFPKNGKAVVYFMHDVIDLSGIVGWHMLLEPEIRLVLTVCGKKTRTSLDSFRMNERNETNFILREIRGASATNPGRDPEPQLLAGAIAVFKYNCEARERRGEEPFPSQVIPAIAVAGTSPTFYKIPIARELVDAVASGTYPEQETIIHRLYPPVPRPERRLVEGMETLDHRRVIMSCFEALKQFVTN